MQLEASTAGLLILIVLMALVTLATRWGGVFIMGFVPFGARVRRFIQAMSGSVLVALLAPLALDGDWGARAALLITAVLMLLFRRPLLAIGGGMLAAALVRQF